MDSAKKSRIQVAIAMDGSRRHYDVAKALHRRGALSQMYTDWYAAPGSWQSSAAKLLSQLKPNLGRRMLERYSDEIPVSKVKMSSWTLLKSALVQSRFADKETYWNWQSKTMAQWIERIGFGNANALFGFIRNIHPALCSRARDRGFVVVGEQMIAPAIIEQREAERQRLKWPNWEPESAAESYSLVDELERRTWDQLDRVVAPSKYVVDGLIECGVDGDRIDLIPYPAEFAAFDFIDRSAPNRELTVGFVGQVNLRKNVPMFLSVAQRLKNLGVKFICVGKPFLDKERLEEYRHLVTFTGAVPRSEVPKYLAQFDMFFFPSTCEGSAGGVIEAMATGLPIITTPNSGTVVENNADGFVADPDDEDAFVAHIETLVRNRDLRLAMGQSARRRVESLTLARYGESLLDSFEKSAFV